MVYTNLVTYIQNQLNLGQTKEVIFQNLLSNNWKKEDVDQAFSAITNPGLTTQNDIKTCRKPLLLIVIAITIVLALILFSLFYFLTQKSNKTVKFQVLEAKDLYVPQDYTVIKVDSPNQSRTIFSTSFENPNTNKRIVLGRYKQSSEKLTCSVEWKIINNISYCVITDPEKGKQMSMDGLQRYSWEKNYITQGISWNSQGITYEITTNDSKITSEELLKVANPFTLNNFINQN